MKIASTSTKRLLLTPLAALAIAAATATASAQQPPPAPIADAADQAFERGRELYKQDKLAEAEAAFAEAWRLKKSQDIAANLGSCELENKKYRDAAEHLAYAVRHAAPTDSDKSRRAAQERLDAALKFIGIAHVRVEPEGAAVYLNGQFVGRAPLEADVYLNPGPSTIEAKLDGFADARLEITGGVGATQDVTLSLTRLQRSKTPAIVLGAVGVVGLGLGAAFLGVEASKRSSARSQAAQIGHACPVSGDDTGACGQLRSTAAASDTFGNASIGAFIVGGALVAGAVTYLVWPTRSAPAATSGAVHFTPTAGQTGGGMLMTGSF